MLGWFKQYLKSTYDDTQHHCDGCGEEYPKSHLIYMSVFDGVFCDRCSELEEE